MVSKYLCDYHVGFKILISEMEEAFKFGLMAQGMRDTGEIIRPMAEAD